MFSTGSWVLYKPPYIISESRVFDTDGRFIRRIGKRGQGPGEDPASYLMAMYNNGKFYSIGEKIIEYDSLGKPTGKEKYIVKYAKEGATQETEPKVKYRIKNVRDYMPLENHLVIFDYPDSLYWIGLDDFEITKSRRISPGDMTHLIHNYHSPGRSRFFTASNDSALFYNCFNDTIFRVHNEYLTPQWVVHMGDYKVPYEVMRDFQQLYNEAISCVRKIRTSIGGVGTRDERLAQCVDDSKMAKLHKNKKRITAVYETSRYLFFLWHDDLDLFLEMRRPETGYYQVAFYDKETGKTTCVEGRGFIDDIHKGKPFYPNAGIWDNKLVASFWPYELEEYIAQEKEKGREIPKELLELSQKIDAEDNPILMIAHLK